MFIIIMCIVDIQEGASMFQIYLLEKHILGNTD